MARSTLPKGAIIELRENGVWHPYQITNANTSWHTGVCMDCVPLGTPIYRCVWKSKTDTLEVRSTRLKKTPATKTEAQWIAEQQTRYDAHIKRQMEYRENFDKVVASCVDANDPDELMSKLFGALIGGKL